MLLLTPGPLTTSDTVRQVANRDIGSRDPEFVRIVKEIREELLKLAVNGAGAGGNEAGGNEAGNKYDVVLMQGSGTFGVEAVITNTIRKDEEVLVLENGAYGVRMYEMCKKAGFTVNILKGDWDKAIDPEDVKAILLVNKNIKHILIVHSETTSGLINPICRIGSLVKEFGIKNYIVDAMSSFGGIPIDVSECNITFLISSANKCIQGIPGFSFVIADVDYLSKCEGNATTLSLDLYDQWFQMNKTGQFRFTPPTQALLAFRQALRELEEEGGPAARFQRYSTNQLCLSEGMKELGFELYLKNPVIQGPIITTFMCPADFNFSEFYDYLASSGYYIYPGKLTKGLDTFRIGSIGDIYPTDISDFLAQVTIHLDLS